MGIVVTTPKGRMEDAAVEAEMVKAAGGGYYFRYLSGAKRKPGKIRPGDKVFYVEDGYVRGYCLLDRLEKKELGVVCETTGAKFFPGWYAIMDARTWCWIEPIPMQGFQGWRYFPVELVEKVKVVGGWLDARPGESEVRERGEDAAGFIERLSARYPGKTVHLVKSERSGWWRAWIGPGGLVFSAKTLEELEEFMTETEG